MCHKNDDTQKVMNIRMVENVENSAFSAYFFPVVYLVDDEITILC